MPRFFVLSVAIVLVSCSGILSSQTAAQDKEPEWGSYFDALRASYIAISSFDVRIENESYRGNRKNQDLRAQATQRLIWEPEEERFLFLSFGNTTNLDEDIESTRISSLLVLKNSCWYKSFPEAQVQFRIEGLADLASYGVPNPLAIGVRPFPQKLFDTEDDESKFWDRLSVSATTYGEGRLSDKRISFTVQYPYSKASPDTETANEFIHVLDTETYMPQRMEWRYHSRGTFGQKLIPRQFESYRWKEKDGLLLPNAIQIATAITRLSESGEVDFDEGMSDISLSWISVNEEADSKFWRPSTWNSVDEIRKACLQPETSQK